HGVALGRRHGLHPNRRRINASPTQQTGCAWRNDSNPSVQTRNSPFLRADNKAGVQHRDQVVVRETVEDTAASLVVGAAEDDVAMQQTPRRLLIPQAGGDDADRAGADVLRGTCDELWFADAYVCTP